MPGILRLKQRREFLTVAGKGRKWATPGLVLQALHRPDAAEGLRYGLTASRKVGGAVVRNRARRRLRALAERLLPAVGRGDTDYVLIARAATVARPFDALEQDLRVALERVERPRRDSRAEPRDRAAEPAS